MQALPFSRCAQRPITEQATCTVLYVVSRLARTRQLAQLRNQLFIRQQTQIYDEFQRGGARCLKVRAAAAEAQAATGDVNDNSEASDLQTFWGWLVANGVKGIGQEDSKVALFATEGGERGLVCEQPLSLGEVVLEVPLRLALTDHPDDQESNELVYQGAPWSVRLACKLLRHLAAGPHSPWAPYLAVLPAQVPASLDLASWSDISALRYPAAQQALFAADWLRADAFEQVSEAASGGANEETFRWALSVVHSRTFANASPGGGVGVRMLVPLVDMLNHGGDVVVGGGGRGLGGRAEPTDSVRWDMVPPDRSSTGGWAMQVTATTHIAPGRELLLSYAERPNDDFFVHYGFVPRANPHDSAVLWPDLESALDWHYEHIGARKLSPEAATPLYQAALEAGRQELLQVTPPGPPAKSASPNFQDQMDGLAGGQDSDGDGDAGLSAELARQQALVQAYGNGSVTAAVVRAFTAVSGGDTAAAERAVVRRCVKLLRDMGAAAGAVREGAEGEERSGTETEATAGAAAGSHGGGIGGGILADLAALLVDAYPGVLEAGGSGAVEGETAQYWASQLTAYCKALLPRYAAVLPEGPAAAAVLSAASGAVESSRPSTPASTPITTASTNTAMEPSGNGGGLKSKYGMPPPPASAPVVPSRAPGGGGGGEVPLAALLSAVRPWAAAGQCTAVRSGGWPALTTAQRLVAELRVYKQMVLWEVVLAGEMEEVAELGA